MENELIKAANLIRKHCRGDASCLECPFTQPVGRSENCSLHSIPADWPEFEEHFREAAKKEIELMEE